MYTSFWYMGIIFPHFLFSFWHFFLLKLITSLDQSLGQSNSQVAEPYAWGLSGAGLLLVESALKIGKLFLCPLLLIIKSHMNDGCFFKYFRQTRGVRWANEVDGEKRFAVWATCQGILVPLSLCRVALKFPKFSCANSYHPSLMERCAIKK